MTDGSNSPEINAPTRIAEKPLTRRALKKAHEQKLQEVSSTSNIDLLTQLPNRRRFEERLREESDRILRFGGRTTVVMLDADNLKVINDKQGHPAGDKYLKSIAEAIKRGIRRDIDFAARYGGDEFVLILPETDAEGADTMWNNSLNPEFIKDGIAISAGAMELIPGNIEETMRIADRAMYGAKHEPTRNGENLMFYYMKKAS